MKANVNINSLVKGILTFKDNVGYLDVEFAGKSIGKDALTEDELKQISFRINQITKNVIELIGAKNVFDDLTKRLIDSEGIEQSLDQLRSVIRNLRDQNEAKDKELGLRGQTILTQGTQITELTKQLEDIKIENALLIQSKENEEKAADVTIETLNRKLVETTAQLMAVKPEAEVVTSTEGTPTEETPNT